MKKNSIIFQIQNSSHKFRDKGLFKNGYLTQLESNKSDNLSCLISMLVHEMFDSIGFIPKKGISI